MTARLLRLAMLSFMLGTPSSHIASAGEGSRYASAAEPPITATSRRDVGDDFSLQDQAAVSGTLRQTMGTYHRPAEFILLDSAGHITHRVQPLAGVQLKALLGRRVVIHGTVETTPQTRHPLLTASQAALDSSLRPTRQPGQRRIRPAVIRTAPAETAAIEPVSPASAAQPIETEPPLTEAPPRLQNSQPTPAETPPAPVETPPNPAQIQPDPAKSEPLPIEEVIPIPMDPAPAPLKSSPPQVDPFISDPGLRGGEYFDDGTCSTAAMSLATNLMYRPFGSVEYLLMTPRRRALDFAVSDPNQNDTPQGPVESLEWDLTSGIRVGAGVCGPKDRTVNGTSASDSRELVDR